MGSIKDLGSSDCLFFSMQYETQVLLLQQVMTILFLAHLLLLHNKLEVVASKGDLSWVCCFRYLVWTCCFFFSSLKNMTIMIIVHQTAPVLTTHHSKVLQRDAARFAVWFYMLQRFAAWFATYCRGLLSLRHVAEVRSVFCNMQRYAAWFAQCCYCFQHFCDLATFWAINM